MKFVLLFLVSFNVFALCDEGVSPNSHVDACKCKIAIAKMVELKSNIPVATKLTNKRSASTNNKLKQEIMDALRDGDRLLAVHIINLVSVDLTHFTQADKDTLLGILQ